MKILLLPLYLLKFWYLDGPLLILSYFVSLNKAFLGLFSVTLMLKTFFKPMKNEYRKGFIGFSILMGMILKSFFLIADAFLFTLLLFAEMLFYFSFLAFPILGFYLAFIKF